MSTQTQSSKVQLVEVLNIASARSEMYGQRLTEALTRAYFAAQNDDAEEISESLAKAIEEDTNLREVMSRVTEAARQLAPSDGRTEQATKIPDEKLEAIFNNADEQVSVIHETLEPLETAIWKGNYPEAMEWFHVVVQAADRLLNNAITEDIARLVDAIKPERIDDTVKESNNVTALTGEEIQTLILALAHGQSTFTDEDAEAVVAWANEVRTNQAILALVLENQLGVSVGPDGVKVGVRRERQEEPSSR